MKRLLLISCLYLSGCASTGYYNDAAIGFNYCNGNIELTCEWSNK